VQRQHRKTDRSEPGSVIHNYFTLGRFDNSVGWTADFRHIWVHGVRLTAQEVILRFLTMVPVPPRTSSPVFMQRL
jgi:hypothetical protein